MTPGRSIKKIKALICIHLWINLSFINKFSAKIPHGKKEPEF